MNSLKMKSILMGALLLASCIYSRAGAAPGQITVDAAHPGAKNSPIFYGLMTEEINHSYDGGLYAELIQNRIFKNNPNSPVHWSVVQSDGASGSIALDNSNPINQTALTTCLRLDIESISGAHRVGIANDGYWGIPVLANTQYRASFYAKATSGFHGPLSVDIESNDGKTIFATAKVAKIDTEWKHYSVYLKTGDVTPSDGNRFVISASGRGTIWFNLVSLFPPTYNNRPNGTRIDLMKLLSGMRPAFLRFPGGNYLEGNSIKERFEWKNTIGPLASRIGHESPWGYRSTDGMGLLEFLEWCQDLHMQPLLAIYAGYSLNGEYVKPGADLEPYVQDALDEIEYVTGSASTKWGKQRSLDGHPAPFPLKYVEIGNEDGFDRSGSYDGRFSQFYNAIKAKHPHLQLIATASVKSVTPDVIDDHYYRSANAMEQDSGHYDRYNLKGPKIFVGEWASTEGSPTPTLNAALGDAAWLTGLERNSDIVIMEAYAPLLVNVSPGGSQWGTNLIGYNALTSFGSPSYYVQAMFGQNHGDRNLPVKITPSTDPQPAPPAPHGGIGVGTWNTQSEYKDIKITSNGKVIYQSNFLNGTRGWRFNTPNWKAQDGVLEQTGDRINSRATTGDRNWTDYTYELKARKISGSEGFLILFHVKDNNDLLWWNVGGWGNSHTAIEHLGAGATWEVGQSSPVTVETGKWYDIKIELRGMHIRCYLDGQLVSEATDVSQTKEATLYSSASRDSKTGDVILHVVNVTPAPQRMSIHLEGMRNVLPKAAGEILEGVPSEVNSIGIPKNVFPKPIVIHDAAPVFQHTFPAYSVSVLRFKTKQL